MKRPRALLLFSEGLDSILAGKVLQAQGLEVFALRFITPFFGWCWKGREEEFSRFVSENFGFFGEVVDLTEDFLEILAHPQHGYGSGFNPCVDCRILMLRKAKELMPAFSASFLATGEVVGQRPMTQQRHTLRHIEKEAGVVGKVLRPLSAQKLWETEPERQGLVDRARLLAIAGRGRKQQLALARELGLKEIPSPAGGCLLTDPNLAPRFRRFLEWRGRFTPREAELLTFGRHFPLEKSWLVLGRIEAENRRLLALSEEEDTLLKLRDIPGPTGLLLGSPTEEEIKAAAYKLVRYAPKARGLPRVPVRVLRKGQLPGP
jgi:hypothetical protein